MLLTYREKAISPDFSCEYGYLSSSDLDARLRELGLGLVNIRWRRSTRLFMMLIMILYANAKLPR